MHVPPKTAAAVVLAMLGGLIAVIPGAPAGADPVPVDITDRQGTVSAQYTSPTGESIDAVVDNNLFSKYFTNHNVAWIQYVAATTANVTSYSLTSANDSPDRNPKSWVFEASTSGSSWVPLDSRSNQTFPQQWAKKTYTFSNTTSYLYYRLRVTATDGSPDLQLAEWQIFGTTTATAPTPAAVTGLTAVARAGDVVEVNWLDATRWETAYKLERSTGSGWTTIATLPPGNTRHVDVGVLPGTAYQYKVTSLGGSNSATTSVTTPNSGPPALWTETFHGPPTPNETVYHVANGTLVSLYRDAELAGTNLTWVLNYVQSLWTHVRTTYGGFADQRLYSVLHDHAGSGGTARTALDGDSSWRNFIDTVGDGYTTPSDISRDVIAHEIGHVVEGGAHEVQSSPAFPIWGDSKWCEIFQYDLYMSVSGLSADAIRWRDARMLDQVNFPVAGTFWFKNWFRPIYDGIPGGTTSGSAVLAKFLQLQAAHFHKYNGVYQRTMNWGEFVHFWSGAVGKDLSGQANTAFTPSASRNAQQAQAKIDFPGVTYLP